ncbi:unnamed protein product [Dovyalis caffra]|uniref:Uncharacterized protein n=1 Tax=Dovyalis caffra TaxID=77055 RepID=A0AAV1RMR7_9ROSI|nr:unnamed protein product [Dovyalis caffra]
MWRSVYGLYVCAGLGEGMCEAMEDGRGVQEVGAVRRVPCDLLKRRALGAPGRGMVRVLAEECLWRRGRPVRCNVGEAKACRWSNSMAWGRRRGRYAIARVVRVMADGVGGVVV